MSYILEALRKADQERSAGSVPNLEAVHESPQNGGRSRWWVWALVVLLLVNGMVLAVLSMRDSRDAPVPVGVRMQPEAPARIVQAPPPAVTQARPAPVTAPVPASVAGVAMVQQPAVVNRPVVKPKSPATAERPAPVQPMDAKVEVPVVPAVPVAEPVSQPAARPVTKASALPYWDDMSIEFRSGFNVPRLDVHVYDTDPQRRFMLINLQKYREGDRLESGAVIEEILPDGVQLSYQGARFIYPK